MRRGRSGLRTLAIATVLAALTPSGASARTVGGLTVPPGWRVANNEVFPGVDLIRFRKPGQEVTVTRIAPDAPVAFRQVLGKGRLGGPGPRTERTTTMCRHLACVVGVNAAFFNTRSGLPVGAIVADGELVRSTRSPRSHIGITGDGRLMLDVNPPRARLVLNALTIFEGGSAISENDEIIDINDVNLPRTGDRIVAYTRRFAQTTPTNGGAELVLEGVGALLTGSALEYQITELRRGPGPIPLDGIVLSALGAGADQLRSIYRRIADAELEEQATILVDPAPPTVVSPRPIVLQDGRMVADPSSLARVRHPRTMLGSLRDGSIVFVTIDGRQRSRQGMTSSESARFLRSVGVVDAANLDGGGSSTMTVRGRIVNHPVGRERSVATALLVTPNAE